MEQLHRSPHISRQRTGEGHTRVEFGMGKRQLGRVKRMPGQDFHQSLERGFGSCLDSCAPRAPPTVELVAEKRIADMRHVNAYLMCSPRMGQDANIVEMLKGVYHEHVRACGPPARARDGHALAVDGVARDGVLDDDLACTHVPVDQRVARLPSSAFPGASFPVVLELAIHISRFKVPGMA